MWAGRAAAGFGSRFRPRTVSSWKRRITGGGTPAASWTRPAQRRARTGAGLTRRPSSASSPGRCGRWAWRTRSRITGRTTRTRSIGRAGARPRCGGGGDPSRHSADANQRRFSFKIRSSLDAQLESAESHTQGLDERRECRRQLPLTRIIEEETGEGRAPILEHAHELPLCEMRRRALLRHERQTHAVERGPDHDLDVIDDQWAVHRDGEGLLALVELPPIHAGGSVTKVDAAVVGEVTRRGRLWVRLEIAWRAHNGRPGVLGYAERYHVPLDEFPEMDAGVEAAGHEVDAAFIGRNVEHDVRVLARELSQLGCEHRRGGNGRHDQPHASCRPVPQPRDQVHGSPNVAQRWAQTREELFSGVCRRNAARRAREQLYAEPLFQPLDRVAERRGSHTKTVGRPGEAPFLGYGKERG